MKASVTFHGVLPSYPSVLSRGPFCPSAILRPIEIKRTDITVKTRIYSILLLAFLTLNFTSPKDSGPAEFVGHWDGMADEQVMFMLDISLDGHDLIVIINAPDQGLVDLESDWTKFSGDHEVEFSFELPEDQLLLLAGKLNKAGKFIGSYEFGEQAGTFIMNKKEKE